MLEEDTIIRLGKTESFEKMCPQPYFVNMYKNVRTLHKTMNPHCYYSRSADTFIPFESLEAVKEYEAEHPDATPFKRCGNCFPKRK